MIDYENDLNAEQLAVVRSGDGPCLVLAGAGSGKTRTITYRVAYLLEQGALPEEILLVTFTNKAAREMISRVTGLMARSDAIGAGGASGALQEEVGGASVTVQADVNRGSDSRMEHKVGHSRVENITTLPWSGTFHHIACRLLQQYAPLMGYRHNFTILDSADSVDLVKLCLKAEGMETRDRRFPSPAVVENMISYARNSERELADVIEERSYKWVETAPLIARVATDYERRKKAANAMDFDDLLVNLRDLLTGFDSARQKLSAQFRYILVDEYQDTNTVQASIVRLFSSVHHNVLVVGDDAQSIYSFRAANIRNILDFEQQYPEAKVFRQETNYRSTPEILRLANNVIAENRVQYEKNLKSSRGAYRKPESRACADQMEEAEFIAKQILQIQSSGLPLRHIAVLFRAAFHSQALEVALTWRHIPYDYRGGVRFFERAHIKDVLAWLRVFHNPADTIAWLRVLNMQSGIGPTTAEEIMRRLLRSASRSADLGNQDKKFQPLTLEFLQNLGSALPSRSDLGWGDVLSVWHKLVIVDAAPAALITAIRQSKYNEYLESQYPDFQERLQDIEQLAAFAERESDIAKFLAEASLQESYTAVVAKTSRVETDKIILSTIHQAKGLEWDTVFIMNLAAGKFPNERASHEDGGLEEERRLFYVAITRAKRQLYLTYPLLSAVTSYLQGPSVFLSEIDRALITERGLDPLPRAGLSFNSGSVLGNYKTGSAISKTKSEEIVYESEDEPFPSLPKSSRVLPHQSRRPVEFLRSIDEL